MPMKLSRPLVVFDIESTGTSFTHDRIVELSVIRIEPSGKTTKGTKRFNPGIPIPKEATEVHKISDEDVKDAPHFSEHAETLYKFIDGCDFAGYNIKKFDLPLLEEEFRRVGIQFKWRDKALVDAYLIWLKAEPRDLQSAVKTFLGKDLIGAHSAEADTAVIMDVIEKQIKKWELPETPKELYEWSDPPNPDAYDPDGKLMWKGDELVIMFGKNKGRTLRDLAANDGSFLNWIISKDFSREVKEACRTAMMGNHPVRKK